ncbi:DUF3891 family protein [Algoriphagus antarcticus]|uniref:Uncharacterized protein DUF3891 n=1 Tax=Algoriphagus antarcticus TaxID=238540 RepID=A0A3E0DUN7_9BACT|nr:DUF3891 family protein [Algoriphagus antarcticus]REG88322.1 uncharacterized protein DUF3891 [Algoriphagus antarcticus]
MIVSESDKGWKILFHKAHALLAMDIGLNLDYRFWPIQKYWAAGMESIGEHDNDQPKWKDRNNLTESGAPLDYRQRTEVDLEQAKAVARSAKYKSSFIVLMVSAHFQKLYGESEEQDVQEFMKELGESRDEILHNLELKKNEVEQCYQFLRFCDDLSLALCQNDCENDKKTVEFEAITGDEKISLTQLANGEFQLEPWIFAKHELVFYAEYYSTTTDFYNEDKELKNDLDLLRPLEKKFVFKKKGHISIPFLPSV